MQPISFIWLGNTNSTSAIVTAVTPQWCANFGGNSMTKRQTTRSRMTRRIAVALATTVAVSTLATNGSNAAVSSAVQTPNLNAKAKVAIFDTFPGWCFGNNPANSALMAARSIYETLFEKNDKDELVPLLAEKATASADLKTWTIELRKGITFHDGSPFDADAVIKNFRYSTSDEWFNTLLKEYARLSPPVSGKPTTRQVSAYKAAKKAGKSELEASIAMAAAAKDVTSLAHTISTATAFLANLLPYNDLASLNPAFSDKLGGYYKTGTHTVVFKLNRPQNDFPGVLYASGRTFMRAPAQFEEGSANDCSNFAIGTGPFLMEDTKSWSTNKLTVVRNPDYWRKDANGGSLPKLAQITFENVKETSLRSGAVLRGTYDAAMFVSGGDGNQIKTLRKSKTKVSEIKSPLDYYPSLWLNQGKPGSPFNPAVSGEAGAAAARNAVIACLDRVNYSKVRTLGEASPAKSIVGARSVMYSTKGFGAYSLKKAKALVKTYKTETAKFTKKKAPKSLRFTTPSDVSSASVANVKFLQSMWKKCGIDVVIRTSESADIIAKAFNSSPVVAKGEYYNAYDSIIILLMEGTDVSFNLPFLLTQTYSTGTSGVPYGYGFNVAPGQDAAKVIETPFTPSNIATTKATIFGPTAGTVLSLNHHSDKKLDDLLLAAQALPNTTDAEKAAVKAKFAEATAYIQAQGMMSSIVHIYYTMFVNKKSTLTGIGETKLPDGSPQRKMSNWGIDWSGVSKTK